MDGVDSNKDVVLIAAMATGDEQARSRFIARNEDLFYQICRSVAPHEKSAVAALDDLLAAPDFADLFAGYDGLASFATFATGTLIEGFLFQRLMRRIREDDASVVYADFGAFFKRRLHAVVRSVVRDGFLQEDAAQWIALQIIRNDYAQLSLWGEQARTINFVLQKLRLLAKDFLNSTDAPAAGRKRELPEALKSLSDLDQVVFKLVYWQHTSDQALILARLASNYPDATLDAIREARARVDKAIAEAKLGGQVSRPTEVSGSRRIDDERDPLDVFAGTPSPEQELEGRDREAQRARFRAALLDFARGLRPVEALYLLKKLQGKPSRVIAVELGNRSVREVYTIGQSLTGKLKTRFRADPEAVALMAAFAESDVLFDGETDLVSAEIRRAPSRTESLR